ncbi:MAG: energy-dependent translational throttle protein EttA [Spirochaetaceae bacterium]|nr:energy-dependent translational throttle protein EttA [Spirochaetaceae bacterium]MDT8297856.1 energy-dependent translational throttle protein EttA [Spirochaetaceae bacterium]
MDETIIFSLVRAGKRYGTKTIFSDITLSFFLGAKIGIIGANGSGKTTLMKIMAGLETDFDGDRMMSPAVSVGYLPQEPDFTPGRTVREVVSEGVGETTALLTEYDEISALFAEPMDDEEMEKLLARQGEVQDAIEAVDGWDLDSRLDLAMEALRCPPDDQVVDHLSGGERRRTALCRLLLSKPDVLLLDEPTNHLDAETVAWLEHHLHDYPGTVILITHDRYFLDNVTGWILELDRGKGIPWKGNYASWLAQKEERLRLEGKSESQRQKNLQKELEWVRQAAPQRRLRSKARLKGLDALRERDAQEEAREAELWIPPGPRLGELVVETHGLTKGFGDKLLFEDLSVSIPPGAIVGVVGANGAGKTTLFRLITGVETADSGDVKVGDTVRIAWADQLREGLDPTLSVWHQISGGREMISLGGKDINSRAWLGRFGFAGNDQGKKVGDLSGGERNRLNLALVLQEEGNLLLLDEPTNDLDVATIRGLEEALEVFPGCAVVVSHDRWFLDRVATHVLAFEGDGKAFWYPGGWSEYDEDRHKRLGHEADIPKRLKYRKLTRD